MGRLSERKNAGTAFDTKIVVFVEGETDEPLLKRLLDQANLQDICFKHDPKGNVPAKVQENMGREEVDGEICFGIVDRDTLIKSAEHLNLFLEQDDTTFLSRRPFGERVHVLLRWEIENYVLLDAEVVGNELDDLHAPTAVPSWDKKRVLERLIALGDSQVPMISACVESVAANGGHVFGENGLQTWAWTHESRAVIEEMIEGAGHAWRGHCADVERLHACEETDHEIRWKAMSRLVDGKRVLAQLCGKQPGHSKHKRFEEFRSRLASREKGRPEVVGELRGMLDGFRREASRIASERAGGVG